MWLPLLLLRSYERAASTSELSSTSVVLPVLNLNLSLVIHLVLHDTDVGRENPTLQDILKCNLSMDMQCSSHQTKPHDDSTCVYKNLTDQMDDIRWLPSSFLVMKEDNIVLEQ